MFVLKGLVVDDFIDDFKPSLRKVEGDKYSGKRSVCFKTISIAGQGVKVLESHAKSSKHNEKLSKSTSSIIKFTSKKLKHQMLNLSLKILLQVKSSLQ